VSTLPILEATNPPPLPRSSAHRHRVVFTTIATAVGVLLIAAGLAITQSTATNAAASATGSDGSTIAATTDATSTTTLAPAIATAAVATTAASGTGDASDVGEAVIPSVVTIEISNTIRNRDVVVGSGSGVIWDQAGHIVTNAHVVDAGDSFEVVLSDGRVYQAEIVGVDATTDLAVLAIDAADLTPVTLGSTAALKAGDGAIAVGSPLGLDGGPSLTVGVISALDRMVEIDSSTTLYGMLQADAPITEGSSGGALVDEQGRLIGITSAVGVSTVGVEGIGFSTPVEIVSRVVAEILATGEATQPILGIGGTTALASLADGGEEPTGVQVERVSSNSPAADAGIEVGDVISSIDGDEITTMAELVAALRTMSAGDTIALTITDGSVPTSVNVTLADG
jgi:S1-C subfamily serine protease